ncbi:MAG: hypothetical protein E6128_01560 [Cutibacterium avidum]|nr:hypothetical protein [Cutibacterium avidum]MDU5418777.1 hypothetical protein [Cutibacterium avidum]
MSATHRLGWRDWADGVSEAIKHALYALDHTWVDAKDPLKRAIEYTVSMAYATKRETVGDRTYGLMAPIIWNIDAALAIQMVLDDGPRDIAPGVDDRHVMTSAIPALLRHALISLDEYTSAMARHDKGHSR